MPLLFFRCKELDCHDLHDFIRHQHTKSAPVTHQFHIRILYRIVIGSDRNRSTLYPLLVAKTPSTPKLTLYPARRVTIHQCFYFGNCCQVEVSIESILQTGSCQRKIQCFLIVIGISEQTIDESANKSIPRTYTIYFVSNIINPRML